MKWIIVALFALALYLSTGPQIMLGDGSDPMPLCRHPVNGVCPQ